MKLLIALALLGLVALAQCQPLNVYRVKSESFEMDQDSDDDVVTGSYTWMSPEGTEYFVKYIADHHGFRIVDSNALPVSNSGVRVDGSQGSFTDHDDDNDSNDSNDHDDNDSNDDDHHDYSYSYENDD